MKKVMINLVWVVRVYVLIIQSESGKVERMGNGERERVGNGEKERRSKK